MKNQTHYPKLMQFKSNRFPKLLLLLFVSFALLNCNDNSNDEPPPVVKFQSPETFLKWNQLIEKLYTFTPTTGLPIPLVPRLFAIYHVTMHDAINSVEPVYETYASASLDPNASPNAALAQAIYEVLMVIGPKDDSSLISIDSLYQETMAAIPNTPAKDKGIVLGKSVAQQVLQAREDDAPYLQVMNYPDTPASGTMPGEFKYLPPLNYALAGYHLQKTWAIPSSSAFYPSEGPWPTDSEAYALDYNEVLQEGRFVDIGNLDWMDHDLTWYTDPFRYFDKKYLSVFWAENSARGLNSMARKVYEKKGEDMELFETTRLFALLHMAIADSYISVMDSKNHFYYWRPITAIHEGETDNNPATQGDPTWTSQLPTPPVPEYPSAHAIAGSAAGQVLINYFGDNVSITLNSGYIAGTRTFNSISQAVTENSLSRIYLGYHFRKAVEVGEELGYELGDYVYLNALKKQ